MVHASGPSVTVALSTAMPLAIFNPYQVACRERERANPGECLCQPLQSSATNAISPNTPAAATNIAFIVTPSTESGSATMAFTTARAAAKPAKSAWLTVMNPKHVRTECDLDDDPRLFAALSAIVEHSAAQVGVPEARAKKLVEATRKCCKEAWSGPNDRPHLRVVCEEFEDRLEVKLKKPSGEKFCENFSLSKEEVARVSPESHEGAFSLTLTEFAAPNQAEKKAGS